MILSSKSIFFPDSEEVMGWDVTDRGLKIMLGQGVPGYAKQLRPHVDSFLSEHGLTIPDIALWLTHPGGPKVIDTIESGLLVILDECLNSNVPKIGGSSVDGNYGMMLSLGPAFSGELVLLQW